VPLTPVRNSRVLNRRIYSSLSIVSGISASVIQSYTTSLNRPPSVHAFFYKEIKKHQEENLHATWQKFLHEIVAFNAPHFAIVKYFHFALSQFVTSVRP
jgi:hypothetical protein